MITTLKEEAKLLNFFSSKLYFLSKKDIEHIIKFTFVTILLQILFSLIMYTSYMYHYTKKVEHIVQETLVEYEDDLDPEALCKIIDCEYMYIDEILTRPDSKGILIEASNNNTLDNKFFIPFLDSVVVVKERYPTLVASLDLSNERSIALSVISLYLITSISLLVLILVFSVYKASLNRLQNLQNKKSSIASRLSVEIANNISHNTNSHIISIANNADSIEKGLQFDFLDLDGLQNNVNTIKEDAKAIKRIIDLGSGLQSDTSNDVNDDMYRLIYSAFKLVVKYNTDRFVCIDPQLKNYTLVHSNLNDLEFKEVIYNFIKNCYEANALKVEFRLHKVEKNTAIIRMVDNGNGMSEKVKSTLFLPKTSTKGEGRGLGMFYNKSIIEQDKGVCRVVNSQINKGTIIEFSVQANKRGVIKNGEDFNICTACSIADNCNSRLKV
jgi:signal transduction histidine kinase